MNTVSVRETDSNMVLKLRYLYYWKNFNILKSLCISKQLVLVPFPPLMPKKNNKRRGSVPGSGETMEGVERPQCEHCAVKVRKPEICGDPETWFIQLHAQIAKTIT